MIVDMMKHFYVFRNCQMSASSCDGVVAIVFLWDAVCIGFGDGAREGTYFHAFRPQWPASSS